MPFDRKTFRILPSVKHNPDAIVEAVGARASMTGDEVADLFVNHFSPNDVAFIAMRHEGRIVTYFQVEPETVICMLEGNESVTHVPILIEDQTSEGGWRIILG